jgi:hypothetical protein
MKSFNRLVLIDKEHEEYSRHPNTFSGMDKVAEKFMLDLSGAAEIPMTRLFGQSPSGFSTGDSDMKNYLDRVRSKQVADMLPQLHRLARVLVPSALGEWPTDFRIELNPLSQITAKEKSEIEKTNAERDQINVQLGVPEGVIIAELKERGVYAMLEDDDVEAARGMSENMPATTEAAEMLRPGPGTPPATQKAFTLTPSTMESIVSVNEGRAANGLPPWPDSDGELSITEFKAKHGGVIAKVANIEEGNTDGKPDKPAPRPAFAPSVPASAPFPPKKPEAPKEGEGGE